MSRDGSEQKVTHVFEHPPSETVGFKVKGLPDPLWITPNHLVWAAKGNSTSAGVVPARRHLVGSHVGQPQWIPAGFLSPGDFVHVPVPRGSERPVDAETAWAYGLYIAEGNALLDGGASGNHHRVNLTMHKNEVEHVQRWADWFAMTFGKTPRVHHRAGRNTTDLVVFPGREVCEWFRTTFGHTAKHKHLPDGALWWDDELKAALVNGWVLGDGHVRQNDDSRPTVSATTISPELAWGMFHIAPATGYWPTLAKLSAGGPRKSDSYTVHLNVGQDVVLAGGEAFYKIAERYERDTPEPVFDLEVTGEHTYVVQGVGVHNSLKGYDEYAKDGGFGFERPQQQLFIVTPERGIAHRLTVQAD